MLVEIPFNHVKCIGYHKSILVHLEMLNTEIIKTCRYQTHATTCAHTMSSDPSLVLLATPLVIEHHQWDPQHGDQALMAQTTRNMDMVTKTYKSNSKLVITLPTTSKHCYPLSIEKGHSYPTIVMLMITKGNPNKQTGTLFYRS